MFKKISILKKIRKKLNTYNYYFLLNNFYFILLFNIQEDF